MQKCMFNRKCTHYLEVLLNQYKMISSKSLAYNHLNKVVSNAKSRTSFESKSNRILNLVQKSNLSALSELTLLKRQQDFSISAFQWGGVECKIKNMHHHFHCAWIQVVANDHRNTIVTHTLIMKRTPHYVKVEKYQKVF